MSINGFDDPLPTGADRVPVLDGEARRRLAYGLRVQTDRGNRYKERKNADELLKRLERASVVIIERSREPEQFELAYPGGPRRGVIVFLRRPDCPAG